MVAPPVFESIDSIAVTTYLCLMAVLTIRNLSDEVRERLRRRAARAGRSMEAEARAILTDACVAEERRLSGAALQAWVDRLYGDERPSGVVDELIESRRGEAASE